MRQRNCSVIIRVYNRIEDLRITLDLIKRYWRHHKYYIIIAGNGESAGYVIPKDITDKADNIVSLREYFSHRKGDSLLLKAGLEAVPESSEYIILLQADTWIFSDDIIAEYIDKMEHTSSVWASAEWVEKYWSLAVDFAIVNGKFLRNHPDIFDFGEHPESYICNYLLDGGHKFQYIRECMPVHRPKIMKPFYNAYGGRFRSFPEAKVITHHIEDLSDGIEGKKLLANICLGRKQFNISAERNIAFENYKLRFLMKIASMLPRSKWFRGKKRRKL